MTGKRHLIDEMVAAHLIASHVLHVGNHNFNQAIGPMRAASKKVNRNPLIIEYEDLWNRLDHEVAGIHQLIWKSRRDRVVDPQLHDRYVNVQKYLDRINVISDELVAKHPDQATDDVKENLRLGREVHQTLVKVVHEHGIVPGYAGPRADEFLAQHRLLHPSHNKYAPDQTKKA